MIPKVVHKFLYRLPEFAEWAKKNCHKGEPALKEFFVDARFVSFFPFLFIIFGWIGARMVC